MVFQICSDFQLVDSYRRLRARMHYLTNLSKIELLTWHHVEHFQFYEGKIPLFPFMRSKIVAFALSR